MCVLVYVDSGTAEEAQFYFSAGSTILGGRSKSHGFDEPFRVDWIQDGLSYFLPLLFLAVKLSPSALSIAAYVILNHYSSLQER